MKEVPAVRLCVVFVRESSAIENVREVSLQGGASNDCKSVAEDIEEASSNVYGRVEAQEQEDVARQTAVEESRDGDDWSSV